MLVDLEWIWIGSVGLHHFCGKDTLALVAWNFFCDDLLADIIVHINLSPVMVMMGGLLL